ncbi:MAG: STAS domain-containing protein [Pseudomonadota bacterium]
MSDDTARFELPPVMKIEDCEALHAFFAGVTDQNVEIDCGRVERLSGLSAQLLLAAQASWQKNAQAVTLLNPSEGFEKGCAQLGLSDLMPQDQVAA